MRQKRKYLQPEAPTAPETPKREGFRVITSYYLDRWSDDNSYMCATYEQAVTEAQETVRESLNHLYKPGMTQPQLMTKYRREGTKVSISPGLPGRGQNEFSDSNYASEYATELIEKNKNQTDS